MVIHVYIALLEIEPTAECTLLSKGAIGAFGRFYIPASSPSEAWEKLTETLKREQFNHLRTEWFVRHDQVSWEVEDSADATAAMREARLSERVVVGRLDSWEAT